MQSLNSISCWTYVQVHVQIPLNGKTADEHSGKGVVASSPSGRCAIFSQVRCGSAICYRSFETLQVPGEGSCLPSCSQFVAVV